MRAACVIALACAACGDGSTTSADAAACRGVGDAGVAGARLGAGGESFGLGGFDWGLHNDCGRDSITIQGAQTDPAAEGFGVALCVPRPSAVAVGPISLADRALVELHGASASSPSSGCVYRYSASATPSGTVTFGGLCTETGASFTVSFVGSVAGTKTCGDAGPAEAATLELSGTALVTQRP